jgi:hypothetical protein
LAEFLASKDIDVLFTREDFAGKGPAYVLAEAEIEVRSAEAVTLDELMAMTGNN